MKGLKQQNFHPAQWTPCPFNVPRIRSARNLSYPGFIFAPQNITRKKVCLLTSYPITLQYQHHIYIFRPEVLYLSFVGCQISIQYEMVQWTEYWTEYERPLTLGSAESLPSLDDFDKISSPLYRDTSEEPLGIARAVPFINDFMLDFLVWSLLKKRLHCFKKRKSSKTSRPNDP